MIRCGPGIGIVGTGSYLPERVVGNTEIGARTGVDPQWIARKTEILARRYAAAHEATSDLAAAAARQALDAARIGPDQVDFLIVSTSTGDSPQPPTACLVQRDIGAVRAACLDINAVCSGFVYGIALAEGLLGQRPGAHALVVAADLYSRSLDFGDRRTAVLLGDGAGAAVLGEVPEHRGVLGVDLRTRADHADLIRVEAGGSRRPASHATVDGGGHFFRMEGRAVSDFVHKNVPQTLHELLDASGVDPSEVHHLVPHQANGVLLSQLVDLTLLSQARVHRTLEKYGNTGSAGVAITLDEASRSGALRGDDMVLLSTFGGGMSMGSCLMRWVPSN